MEGAATLSKVEVRKNHRVRCSRPLIGEGTHEWAIINVAKFATRIAEKKRKSI
jgi:predicted thioesterase